MRTSQLAQAQTFTTLYGFCSMKDCNSTGVDLREMPTRNRV
jgi:hypothetical protein